MKVWDFMVVRVFASKRKYVSTFWKFTLYGNAKLVSFYMNLDWMIFSLKAEMLRNIIEIWIYVSTLNKF